MHVLHKFDDSRFWQRLRRFDDDDYKGYRQTVRDLITSVSKVAGQSDLILDQVSRFLTQYTVDALELRELRLKIKLKGEATSLIGYWGFRHLDFRAQPARGTDEPSGQQWLLVTDTGVGMTEAVIKNYFTQIGKSHHPSRS